MEGYKRLKHFQDSDFFSHLKVILLQSNDLVHLLYQSYVFYSLYNLLKLTLNYLNQFLSQIKKMLYFFKLLLGIILLKGVAQEE